MRNQWKPHDKLRQGKHKKQGDVSQEDRNTQAKVGFMELELLEKQLAKMARRREKKNGKRAK